MSERVSEDLESIIKWRCEGKVQGTVKILPGNDPYTKPTLVRTYKYFLPLTYYDWSTRQ